MGEGGERCRAGGGDGVHAAGADVPGGVAEQGAEAIVRAEVGGGAEDVEQEHIGVVEHGDGQGDLLLHAAGEGAGLFVGPVGEVEQVEQLVDAAEEEKRELPRDDNFRLGLINC